MHYIRLLISGLISCLLTILIFPAVTLAQEPQPQITATDQGITFSWQLPEPQFEPVTVDGNVYWQASLPGLVVTGEPGAPQLPRYSKWLGLPPEGGATLKIVSLTTEQVSLAGPLLPAPQPQPVRLDPTAASALPTPDWAISPDSQIYTVDAFWPAQFADLGQPQQVRDHRLAALHLNPVRFNPVQREVEIVREITLEITFERPAPPPLTGQQTAGDAVAQALAATLLNPAAAGWTVESPPAAPSPEVEIAGASSLYKISVTRPGLHRLTYADLQAAGLPLGSLDPRTVQLSYGPDFTPVPIVVSGEADGRFDSGDRILFYAPEFVNRYTDVDAFFLSDGHANPPRMQTQSAAPQGLPAGVLQRTRQVETNRRYESLYAGRDGDHWFWDSLSQSCYISGAVSKNYTIPLNLPLLSAGQSATLTAWLRGASNPAQSPDHFVKLYFNNTLVGQQTWNGQKIITMTAALPAGLLRSGDNQIRVTLPGLDNGDGNCQSGEVVVEELLVDAFAVEYPTNQGRSSQLHLQGEMGQRRYNVGGWSGANLLAFDVTAPLTPTQLSGWALSGSSNNYTISLGDNNNDAQHYLIAPEQSLYSPQAIEPVQLLAAPPAGADYIIITHPDFVATVAPLAAHRAGQGLRVFTADVEAVYNTFGGGRADPQAIHRFLAEAYDNWQWPKPMYVLLVGDGAYDLKNYSGFNPTTYIPPYLAPVDPHLGETAADNRLVTFGKNDFPSMIIGRLPVNSPAQAETVVNKIIQYETQALPGGWNVRHLFVADDMDYPNNPWIRNFPGNANLAYTQLISPHTSIRFYYSPTFTEQPEYFTDPVTLRNNFVKQFNWGAGLVTFHGHSSWHQWAEEQLFRWSLVGDDNDVNRLNNGMRLPVVLQMTCFTGFFHHPEYPTMDESLLRRSGGGAIAVWGATGLGIATGHQALQEGVYSTILAGGSHNLGTALLAGKLSLLAEGNHLDLLNTYTLFGDPALTVDFTVTPFTDFLYLPLVER